MDRPLSIAAVRRQGDPTFESNADSNAGELQGILANDGELLTPALDFKMNSDGPWRTLANDEPANFKTDGRHTGDDRGKSMLNTSSRYERLRSTCTGSSDAG